MPWVVDTCLLIDVLEDHPAFGDSSAQTLDECFQDGLVVCPMTYAELAPAFGGDLDLQNEFLTGIGVGFHEDWNWGDTLRAHAAWQVHVQRRRKGLGAKRPLADILIGAFASRYQGLLTRNPKDFEANFPSLALRVPSAGA